MASTVTASKRTERKERGLVWEDCRGAGRWEFFELGFEDQKIAYTYGTLSLRQTIHTQQYPDKTGAIIAPLGQIIKLRISSGKRYPLAEQTQDLTRFYALFKLR